MILLHSIDSLFAWITVVQFLSKTNHLRTLLLNKCLICVCVEIASFKMQFVAHCLQNDCF